MAICIVCGRPDGPFERIADIPDQLKLAMASATVEAILDVFSRTALEEKLYTRSEVTDLLAESAKRLRS